MKKRQLILGLVVLAALVGLAIYAQHRYPIHWHEVAAQVAHARLQYIAIGIGCIYFGFVFRSVRWARLLKHHKHVPPFSLIGTQVIGFTAIALIGRVADPVRPYLVSRKTTLPLSSQFAVYIVERLFDAGSMALIFSLGMLGFSQDEVLRATAHSKIVTSLGHHSPQLAALFARYGGLLLTLAGALFLVAVRVSGPAIATFSERMLGLVSKKLGAAVGEKIRIFHSGLDTMRTFGEFAATAGLSLAMWVLIAFAYLITCKAFTGSPQLAGMTASQCVLLMIVSGVSSIVQLPIVGWFTQIGLVTIAISNFFGVTPEASVACAASLLLVTFLCTIPVGLIWAQFEHVSLRKVTHESEEAEEIVSDQPPSANSESA
ncbi:MAG TPA: lysylphosphatidylglycerol synthase transmembrane domain-containing protein [Terracidiphilus sp.]